MVSRPDRQGDPARLFPSVPALITTIDDYLQVNNRDPKSFVWTATAEAILEKVRRGRVALRQVASQN